MLGIHINMPATVPPDIAKALQCGEPAPSGLSARLQRAEAVRRFQGTGLAGFIQKPYKAPALAVTSV